MVKKLIEEALQQLRDGLEKTAARYWVFGVCPHQLAFAHYNAGDYSTSTEMFSDAVEARIKAEDYRSAEDRKSSIALSTKWKKIADDSVCISAIQRALFFLRHKTIRRINKIKRTFITIFKNNLIVNFCKIHPAF